MITKQAQRTQRKDASNYTSILSCFIKCNGINVHKKSEHKYEVILKKLLLILICFACQVTAQNMMYPWMDNLDAVRMRICDIPPPADFTRVSADSSSFAFWLRHLPLRQNASTVMLYNGRAKRNQGAHFAIADIDVGSRNLQQCADAVMRLYAEYKFSRRFYDDIHFNFTSGDRVDFLQWAGGVRPDVQGNRVTWHRTAEPDTSYASFRDYLNIVFMYAGSYSLSQEMQRVAPAEMRIGDVFIQGGFPGHAVIVVDTAQKPNGKAAFLLAQSYMPAQDIHILKNPQNTDHSPWYLLREGQRLVTPEWTFSWDDVKRFPK